MSLAWLFPTLCGAYLAILSAIQTWALTKILEHEKQLYRLVSDRESEKDTIARVHNDFESRLRKLEQRVSS